MRSVALKQCCMQEADLVRAAEIVWDDFAAAPSTAAAAQRMMQHAHSSPVAASSYLGHSAWNAYSLNIDYRTGGKHMLHILRHALVLDCADMV